LEQNVTNTYDDAMPEACNTFGKLIFVLAIILFYFGFWISTFIQYADNDNQFGKCEYA
jgi:hypothetical protein